VLALTALGLAGIAGGAALRGRARPYVVWLVAGVLAIGATAWGLDAFGTAVEARRAVAFQDALAGPIANPNANQDVGAAAGAGRRGVRAPGRAQRRARARGGRRGPAPAVRRFLVLAGRVPDVRRRRVAVFFGLRVWPRAGPVIDRIVLGVAIPLVSILLALVVAAVVILTLQPTPLGRDFVIDRTDDGAWPDGSTRSGTPTSRCSPARSARSRGSWTRSRSRRRSSSPAWRSASASARGCSTSARPARWCSARSSRCSSALRPGPPLGGAAARGRSRRRSAAPSGARSPAWLKARFGANEVINTILLNFVAASLLLFMLSASPTFAASAVRVIQVVGVAIGASVVALLVPPTRRLLGRAPRLSLAVVAVAVLAAAVVVAQPRPGDAPVVLQLPFKVPGSEPKSYELSESARLPRLPALFGIDLRATPGANTVPVDVALFAAPRARVAAAWRRPRRPGPAPRPRGSPGVRGRSSAASGTASSRRLGGARCRSRSRRPTSTRRS
jgi:hypothetical protein